MKEFLPRPVRPANDLIQMKDNLLKDMDDAITWYMRKKKRRRRLSKITRLTIVILGLIGALIPVLSPMFPQIDPQWGYAPLLVAGALTIADRQFDWTSGWTRYFPTALKISELKNSFQNTFVLMEKRNESRNQCETLLLETTAKFWEIIQSETESWQTSVGDSKDIVLQLRPASNQN